MGNLGRLQVEEVCTCVSFLYLDQTVEVPIELLDGKVNLIFGLKAMACYPVSSEIPSPPGAPDLKIFCKKMGNLGHVSKLRKFALVLLLSPVARTPCGFTC